MRLPFPTVDLHADLLWRTERTGKDPWADCPGEMLDFPRMLEHGPSLQCFAVYTPDAMRGEEAEAYARTLLDLWDELVARGEGRLGWARTAADLDALAVDGLTGLLTMESAAPFAGKLDAVDRFHDAGVRIVGLTHNARNETGDGCMLPAEERRGLTSFGRAVVRRCAEVGMLLDVSHLAPEGFSDLMDEVEALDRPPPVVATHAGCMAVTEHPRNLDDGQLARLAATGGVFGITLYPPHLRVDGVDGVDSLGNALEHLSHAAEVCGPEHLAVGADLDGFSPPGLEGGDSPACYGSLAAGLAERGFSPAEVEGVLGGNALRVLRSVMG